MVPTGGCSGNAAPTEPALGGSGNGGNAWGPMDAAVPAEVTGGGVGGGSRGMASWAATPPSDA
eukprot:9991174-Alexandrium_andersonii.AAC.1